MSSQVTALPPRQKPRDEMTTAELKRRDHLDLRSLDLCISMLERVNSVRVASYVRRLLTPPPPPADIRASLDARGRAQRAHGPIRHAQGDDLPRARAHMPWPLRAHRAGAACLPCVFPRHMIRPHTQRMATSAFKLFLSQITSEHAPEQLKVTVLEIVFDVVMVHEREFLDTEDKVRILARGPIPGGETMGWGSASKSRISSSTSSRRPTRRSFRHWSARVSQS
jgi:condensin complex subunit 3